MAKKVATYAIFTSLALIFAYLEGFLPLPIAVPGIKLGFANIVVILMLYLVGEKPAFGIGIMRVALSSMLFAGIAGLLYALSGSIISFFVMMVSKRMKAFSIIGVSTLGGVAHNIAQITVAALVTNTVSLTYYLPILLIAGIATGLINGLLSQRLLIYLERFKLS